MKNVSVKTLSVGWLLGLLLFLVCCKQKEEKLMTRMENAMGDTLSKGTYVTVDHETRGNVAVLKKPDGSRVIQFDNYHSTPAPNIDIFLSKRNTYTTAADCPRLGDLPGTGSFIMNVPEGVTIEDYPYIVSWCVDYSALMGYAEMKKIN